MQPNVPIAFKFIVLYSRIFFRKFFARHVSGIAPDILLGANIAKSAIHKTS